MAVDAQDATQILLDERAIYELLTRYSRGVDRCDEELLRSCYHPDATDDHGWFKGLGIDFAGEVVARHKGGPITQHSISNVRLDVRGDVAYGETYVTLRTTGPNGEPVSGFGRYIDRFERRDGEWRIADRKVTLEGAPPGQDLTRFLQATQDRTDPSYVG
jgi:ketosteroid isomerase-like protein